MDDLKILTRPHLNCSCPLCVPEKYAHETHNINSDINISPKSRTNMRVSGNSQGLFLMCDQSTNTHVYIDNNSYCQCGKIDESNIIKKNDNNFLYGWVCPACKKCNSPYTDQCVCPGVAQVSATTISGTTALPIINNGEKNEF